MDSNFSDYVDSRRMVIDRLRRDLIGPSWLEGTSDPDLNEVLDLDEGNPTNRYLSGYLEPSRNRESITIDQIPETIQNPLDVDKDVLTFSEVESEDDRSDSAEREILLRPSSMGLSFRTIDDKVRVEIEWGEYSSDGEGTWSRVPVEWKNDLDLHSGERPIEPSPAIGVRLLCRVEDSEIGKLVTIRLVNDRSPPVNESGKPVAHSFAMATIFQPRITVSSKSGFSDVRSNSNEEDDPTMSILYRNSRVLSLGHNVGVEWADHGNKIWTEHIPEFEIPKMIPDKDLAKFIPTMGDLSDLKTLDKALNQLEGLLSRNRDWIESAESLLKADLKSGVIDPNSKVLSDAVKDNINRAKESLSRMESGIETLRSDQMVREAFVLSNSAIQISQEGPTGPAGLKAGQFKWFPFQIAFQLLNLNGLISTEKEDSHWDEREEILDLAWFPTGGGKTEAYLGLIATIGFYRRLKYPDKEKIPSVHAIMRYTLRLLTLDQSERLVRLVAAMNIVAERHHKPAVRDAHPFRVGMWVGQKSSPNKLDKSSNGTDAWSIIKSLKAGKSPNTSTRAIMFDACPWCGSETIANPHNWKIGKLNGRKTLVGRCEGEACPFDSDSGIPFTPVDEDIYNNPPSILLGTADKFVQAAYNRGYGGHSRGLPADVRTLLGCSDKNRPPDLVIQDELHLLSGPLGSLAGLLETALDVAWSQSCDGHRPKYVAATATIRGAERDARLMFGRKLNVFPPPIDSASDNFFAREVPIEEKPGRIHVSLLAPPGKSRTVADLPVASILQSGEELKIERGENFADPYWTLVCYYNSLRELGGMQSSLAHRIKREWIPLYSGNESARNIEKIEELTSRVPQDRLVSSKKKLENKLAEGSSVDVVVTSKMFEVGIDISRLGVMAINGQPKSNSEYIQASGRVGRKYPGLVVSMLRSTYPRDQSHYENHRSFHQEIYRHVDRTSTTPFSLRSLDRALDTTLMALVRLVSDYLAPRDSLNQLETGNQRIVRRPIENAIQEFRDSIEGRLKQEGYGADKYLKEVLRAFDKAWWDLVRWVEKNSENHTCCWTKEYGSSKKINEKSWARGSDDETKDGRQVISSLRDVADEIPVARTFTTNIENNNRFGFHRSSNKIPESHLFSHTSPGSIWEKDGRSYLTLGINNWQNFSTRSDPPMLDPLEKGGVMIKERHITYESTLLGNRERSPVKRIRALPTNSDNHGWVTYQLFPRTHRCDDGHLSEPKIVKEGEDTICGVEGCNKSAIQQRFVSLCSAGHLHDFNYSWWVHRGSKTSCNSKNINLELRKGHAFTLGQWILKCRDCGSRKDMRRVPTVSEEDRDASNCGKFGEPWLSSDWGDREACSEKLVHRQVGAASVTYNNSTRILLIPPTISWDLANSEVVYSYLKRKNSASMMKQYKADLEEGLVDDLHEHLEGSEHYPDNDESPDTVPDIAGFFDALEEFSNLHTEDLLTVGNIRNRERSGLYFNNNFAKGKKFSSTKIKMNPEPWGSNKWPIQTISRVDRLTELEFVTGISRVLDSNPEIPIDEGDLAHPARPTYGTGRYNFGEGIFINVSKEWLTDTANKREAALGEKCRMQHSFEPGRLPSQIKRQIPCLEDERNRNAFTILHSLSHLLIRKACEESGYSLGSVRERLYFDAEGGDIKYASILLYTSGPSSDGTLGGLAGQTTLKRMKQITESALFSLHSCSNDPVCYEHEPLDREPNGAACHTCLVLPETSCECRNHMLDRNWGV